MVGSDKQIIKWYMFSECYIYINVYTVCHCLSSEYCRSGFGVCVDLRYPELARLYAQKGKQSFDFLLNVDFSVISNSLSFDLRNNRPSAFLGKYYGAYRFA